MDLALHEGQPAGWLYRRAAAGPVWHQCWIQQHGCKRFHFPPGKPGPRGQGKGCLNLFPKPATNSFIQPEQVKGKGSLSRSCIFPTCWFPCRHQQPKVFSHVQTPLCAHKVLVPSITWTASFSEELSASSQQKRGEKSIKQFLIAKCHFDGTDIFGKASINFNVLFCLFKKNQTQKMSKYVILTFSEPNVLLLHPSTVLKI